MFVIYKYIPYEGMDDIFWGTLEEVEEWFRKGLPVNQNHIYGGPWQGGHCLDDLVVYEEGPSVRNLIEKVKE
jgi:hypothetical protein